MFAARANQENTLHHQKTPSTKTPFHPGGGKNNENVFPLPAGGKPDGGKPDRNVFLTPANPRGPRAPLGNKTTNAKALQQPVTTLRPAPPSINATNNNRTRCTPKIKVHHSFSTTAEENPLEREVESMPPREIPMLDHSLDEEIFPRTRDLTCLSGRNLTRGWYGEYALLEQKDDEGEMSDFGEQIRELEERNIKKKKKTVEAAKLGTVRAKGAVSALSKRETAMPMPIHAVKEKKPLARGRSIPQPQAMRTTEGGNPRFAAAKVASNSTIGYSKGRVVSRPRPAALHMKSEVTQEKKTTLEDLLTGFGDLGVDDAEAEALGLGGNGDVVMGDEEEGDVFQLEVLGEDDG